LLRFIALGLLFANIGLADIDHRTPPKLIIAVQGTSTILAPALGVLQTAYEEIPAVKNNEVLLTTNSGGAFVATYFACRGFSEATFVAAEKMARNFPRANVKESLFDALNDFFWKGKKLEDIEQDLSTALKDQIQEVVQNGRCKLQTRLAIVTARGDRLKTGAEGSAAAFAQRFKNKLLNTLTEQKVIDYESGLVLRRHRNVTTGAMTEDALGKSCTLYADDTTLEALSAIPYAQRECDHMPLEVPSEYIQRGVSPTALLEEAIGGAVAEPGMGKKVLAQFPELLNREFDEHHISRDGKPIELKGGLSHPVSLVKSLRKAYPSAYVLGTGRPHFLPGPTRLITEAYTIDVNEAHKVNMWWFDLEVPVSSMQLTNWVHNLDQHPGRVGSFIRISDAQVFDQGLSYGKKALAACLKEEARCIPADDQVTAPGRLPALKTRRGLEGLVKQRF
jgi:hypothetical protein